MGAVNRSHFGHAQFPVTESLSWEKVIICLLLGHRLMCVERAFGSGKGRLTVWIATILKRGRAVGLVQHLSFDCRA